MNTYCEYLPTVDEIAIPPFGACERCDTPITDRRWWLNMRREWRGVFCPSCAKVRAPRHWGLRGDRCWGATSEEPYPCDTCGAPTVECACGQVLDCHPHADEVREPWEPARIYETHGCPDGDEE